MAEEPSSSSSSLFRVMESLNDHVSVVEQHTGNPPIIHEVPSTVLVLPGRPLWSTANPSWSVWRVEENDDKETAKAKRDLLAKWRVSRTESVQIIIARFRGEDYEFLSMPHSSYFFSMGYAPEEDDLHTGLWFDELMCMENNTKRKRIIVCRDLIRYLKSDELKE